jgi:hypothetical protein
MALDAMKQEWLRFKHDRPGERFDNYRRRMSHAPQWKRVLRAIGGGTLVLLGVVFCFLPGPGLLGIAFGLALLAGFSPWLAKRMDRGEPRLRRWTGEKLRAWKHIPKRTRALIGTAVGIAAGLVAVILWDAIW